MLSNPGKRTLVSCAPVAYSRPHARPFPVYTFALLLAVGGSLPAQSSGTRPALLGTGRTSLINVLDAQRLMKRGQKDGVLSFSFGVTVWGYPGGMLTYGGTPDSAVLSQELLDQFERAKFIPAMYEGKPAGAVVSGTLVFAITNGSPHLRIF